MADSGWAWLDGSSSDWGSWHLCFLLYICRLRWDGSVSCVSHPFCTSGLDKKCCSHCDGRGLRQQAETHWPLKVQIWLTHHWHFTLLDKASLTQLNSKPEGREIYSTLFLGETWRSHGQGCECKEDWRTELMMKSSPSDNHYESPVCKYWVCFQFIASIREIVTFS